MDKQVQAPLNPLLESHPADTVNRAAMVCDFLTYVEDPDAMSKRAEGGYQIIHEMLADALQYLVDSDQIIKNQQVMEVKHG